MASKAAPDDWAVEIGTWGTDIDRDESDTISGGGSLKFLATPVATRVLSKPEVMEKEAGYTVTTIFKASSATAGNIITIELLIYDDSGALVSTQTIYNAVATAPGSFEVVSRFVSGVVASTGRFVAVRLSKAAQSFSVLWDAVIVERLPQGARLHGVSGNLTVGSTTTITFLNTSGNFTQSLYLSAVGNTITLKQSGLYLVNAFVLAEGFAAGESLSLTASLGGAGASEFGHPTRSTQDLVGDQLQAKLTGILQVIGAPVTLQLRYFVPSASGTPSFVSSTGLEQFIEVAKLN